MKDKLLLITFRNLSVASLYIFGVSQLMQNGSKIFGETDNMLTPFVLLLLFCLSAAIVGGLTFGKPLLLFLDGKKDDGTRAVIYSILWLGFYTLFGFLILFILRS